MARVAAGDSPDAVERQCAGVKRKDRQADDPQLSQGVAVGEPGMKKRLRCEPPGGSTTPGSAPDRSSAPAQKHRRKKSRNSQIAAALVSLADRAHRLGDDLSELRNTLRDMREPQPAASRRSNMPQGQLQLVESLIAVLEIDAHSMGARLLRARSAIGHRAVNSA